MRRLISLRGDPQLLTAVLNIILIIIVWAVFLLVLIAQ
jgi:hypothetical protein